MTIVGVGNPLRSQFYLMQLAGLVVERRAKVCDPSAAQIAQSKAQGRQALMKLTGEDFGDDIEQWYLFLIVGDYGLTHPYGYGPLRKWLRNAGYSAPFKKEVLARLKTDQHNPSDHSRGSA